LKRTFPSCTLLAILFAASLCAQHGGQESGHGPGGSPHELLWKWANFALLAGGLGYLVYRKAGGFFRSRTEAIRQGIEEADRLRRDAEARAAEMEARLANLESEIEALRSGARSELAAESERLQRETEETLRKLREQAGQEIASAVKAAQRQVRARAAELAVRLAAAKIRAGLTPQDDQALVASLLNDLEQGAGGGSGKEMN